MQTETRIPCSGLPPGNTLRYHCAPCRTRSPTTPANNEAEIGMKFRPALAVFGIYVLAHGAISNAADAVGDAKKGQVLFYTCHGCHGVPDYRNAYPNYSVPNLGGQHAKYIVAALVEYASGDRPHQTMHAQAVSLSEQDRRDIA